MVSTRPNSAALELFSAGLEKNSSLVFAPKLALHRSSIAGSLFKSKSGQRMARPVDNSEVAQLRKKAGQMDRDFQTLLSAHERQEAALVDLRQKLRQLRGELEGREKALELARRTVERLMAEKGSLEAGAAGTQAYVRKLEARLLSVRGAAELQQHCGELKGRLDSQAHALHEAEARASVAEEAARAAALDAACLRRGLELAAEQLTRSAGPEVPGTLLKAVARGQEEALELSVQLSDARQHVAQLSSALEQARAHLQAQQTALAQQQGERQQLQQRAEAAEAALEKQRAATAELRNVLDALRPKAGALAEERELLRQQLELERTAAADARKEVMQLRTALRQKAATEAALRDELRHALAGEGLTPSPPLRACRPRACATTAARMDSRADASRHAQQQQQQGKGMRPAFRASPPGAAADSAALRQGGPRQLGQAQRRRSSGGNRQGLILAEPSPTRALARLQDQRRAQQDSRLGSHKEWTGIVAGDLQQGALEAAWELEEGIDHGAPAVPMLGGSAAHERHGSQPRLPGHEPKRLHAMRSCGAAEPPGCGLGPMGLHAAALDEQIALLELDLAQLEGAPSPIAQLKQRAGVAAGGGSPPARQARQQQQPDDDARSIAAWRPNNAFQAAPDASRRDAQSGCGTRQLQSPGVSTPVPPLWHSNPFAASPPPKQQQQQQRPAEAAGSWHGGADGALTVRAQGPHAAQDLQAALPQQGEPGRQLEGGVALVSTATAGLAGAAAPPALVLPKEPAVAAGAALPAGSPQQTEDWLWDQLQQALSPVAARPPPLQLEAPGSAAASSPSLRLPGECGTGRPQPADDERAASSAAVSEVLPFAGRPDQQQQEQQQQQAAPARAQPAGSQGSCGEGGVASLSRHWDLPSPGPGNSDWLSNELEPDPEQLEVNSRQTPQKRQAAAAVAAAAAGSDCDCHGPKRPAGGGCASSRAGEDGWPADSAGSRRESAQLLPGLPLVPRSPVSGQALPAPPSEAPNTPEADAVEAVRAQQPAEGPLQRCGPPAQQFQALAPADQVLLPCSLFDLAGLDLELQDLLG